MAKTVAVQEEELASAFRAAHKRADSELSGFSRAFKIRDRIFGNRVQIVRVLRGKKKASKKR